MKIYNWCILLFVFGLGFGALGQNKHALIIAIGKYDSSTNWPRINSEKDVPIIQKTLQSQGFKQIDVLKNEQATRYGILMAFKSLRERLKRGDIVCLHFSSHGQQVEDFNGDEKSDGLDEAIVPYDAPLSYKDGYRGEKHLLDDEIREELIKIRKVLGPIGDVLVLMDACHSGTAARGGIARGGKGPLVSPGFKFKTYTQKEPSIYESPNISESELAKLIVISAAQANELNYEYQGNGSLTLGFSKAMSQLRPNETYRSLFSNIMSEMNRIAPNQTPAIEGEIDRQLFSGKVRVQEPFYTISFINANTISIVGGNINGLFKDCEIAIHQSGTNETTGLTPLASGKVFYADATSARALVNSNLLKPNNNYWVFITKKSFGDQTVRISLGKTSSRKSKKQMMETLSTIPLAIYVEDNPDLILQEGKEGAWQLLRPRGLSEYETGITSNEDWQSLKKSLKHFAQARFITDLNLSHPGLELRVELIPIKMANRRFVDTIPVAEKMNNGVMEFTEGDFARLKITNTGTVDCYYTILDIQPDGIITPVVPNPYKNEPAKKYFIKAGDSYIIQNKFLSFAPPYGKETYKVIASTEELNIAPIVMTKGASARGALKTEIEKLFHSSYTLSRGTPVGTLDNDAALSTYNIIFKIKSQTK